MANSFSMGINVFVDIKPGVGEKSISPGHVRYAIRIIYTNEKITYLGFTIKRNLRNKM